jgi:hypothetical protein
MSRSLATGARSRDPLASIRWWHSGCWLRCGLKSLVALIFRPSLLGLILEQAEAWEHLALRELEAYFALCDAPAYDRQPRKPADTGTRWPMAAAA